MKNEKDFVVWIRKNIDYYLPILGQELNEIKIEKQKDGYLAITFTYPYIDPTIRYSEKALDSWKKGELKKELILHELVHIITDPLYAISLDRFMTKDIIENERERLTDIISAIIRRLDK